MNFYPFNIGDYAGKTRHLTWDEDMAYRRLLDAYYSTEAALPADRRQIYRLTGAQTAKQKQAVDTVLNEFFDKVPEGFRNARCDEEIAKAAIKREKAKHSAMLSVEARSAKSIRGERMEVAKSKGTHSKQEWQALVDVCGHSCVRCGATGHLDKDHIKPVYQGGSDGIDNLQPLCAKCNASKGPEDTDHRPADWKQRLDLLLSERSASVQRSLNERLAPNPNPNPNPNIDGIGTRARDLDEHLERTLRKAAGWESHPNPKLAVTGPITALIEAGADIDLDVLPVIRALAPKVRSPGWTYFVNAIAQARDDRIAASTVVSQPATANGATNAARLGKPTRKAVFEEIHARIDRAEHGSTADSRAEPRDPVQGQT